MNGIWSRLSALESRLQSLIEGSAGRLLPATPWEGGNLPQSLTHAILQAMQAGAQPVPGGGLQAPNLYRIHVPPRQAELLEEHPAFLDELTSLMLQMLEQSQLALSGPLSLKVEADPGLAADEVRVTAQDSLSDLTPTRGLRRLPEIEPTEPPQGAFLIVDGTQVYNLDGSVVNIGRRPDNQLCIDDPRVSRLHAQLRLVHGRYVLFDLDSTGGSYVNGRRIRRHILATGDVISLAGLPLVYGQDEDTDVTQELPAMEDE